MCAEIQSDQPYIVMMGQTPPPWHGQAVATQLLFDHDWPGYQVHRLRMSFSSEIEQVGRFRFGKLFHALELVKEVLKITNGRDNGILMYPPASPNWVPFLRDLLILPLIRRRFAKVVYIYHAGGVGAWLESSRFRRWLAGVAYGRADLSMEVAREKPAPHEILHAHSWAWAPYGVAVPSLPTRCARNSKTTNVLFVGSLQEGKGVLEILKTASLLKGMGMKNDFTFHLVGRWFSNEFKEDVLCIREELGLTEMVILLGELTGDAKWDAYHTADVFFFPTHYESEAFPLVLIEALACGLPVVTTRWRGIPDLVGNCKTATLCNVRSPQSYVEALMHWRSCGDTPWIAGESRRFYDENYRPAEFLSQICSLIGQLASPTQTTTTQELLDSHPPSSRAFFASKLSHKPHLTILGQTPPPWHGQSVATKILFDHEWPDFNVEFIRMDYSKDIDEVGRFHPRKVIKLLKLIFKTRKSLSKSPDNILFYPPGSAKWIPFLRDVIFLCFVRGKAKKSVFIYHASGLAAFTQSNILASRLAKWAYHGVDMALEVAEEKVAPHNVFHAKHHQWCPCGIEVPELPRNSRVAGAPLKVLFVGSLQESKGVLDILRTASQLKAAGHGELFHFDLVGRWMDNKFKRIAMTLLRALQLEHMVSFKGQLTGDDKWQAYRNSDIFFFPTHYPSEASPIVLMEALATGLPIITTQWNGIPALLEGCTTAKILPIHSPSTYTDALIEIQSDIASGIDYGIESKDFYQKRFLPEIFIERVEKALQCISP